MKKKETIHKTLTYLKLFFGMGFVWYFEILAFALRSYNLNPKFSIVPDTLNMLQVIPHYLTNCLGCLGVPYLRLYQRGLAVG